MSEITQLLEQSQAGDGTARDRLYTLLYSDLKRLARAHLSKAGRSRWTRARSCTRPGCAATAA